MNLERPKWPLEYVKDIVSRPQIEWRDLVLQVPEHYREMVRAHLRCYVDRMRCKRGNMAN